MTGQATGTEIPVRLVQLHICDPCLSGAGGECHVPGCAMWMGRPPGDPPLGERPGVTVVTGPDAPALAANLEAAELRKDLQRHIERHRNRGRITSPVIAEVMAAADEYAAACDKATREEHRDQLRQQREAQRAGLEDRDSFQDALRQISARAAGKYPDITRIADEALGRPAS